MATIQYHSCRSFYFSLGRSLGEIRQARYHQHRLRQTVYKFCAYERPGGKRFPYFHGLAWVVAGQCVIERLYFLANNRVTSPYHISFLVGDGGCGTQNLNKLATTSIPSQNRQPWSKRTLCVVCPCFTGSEAKN